MKLATEAISNVLSCQRRVFQANWTGCVWHGVDMVAVVMMRVEAFEVGLAIRCVPVPLA